MMIVISPSEGSAYMVYVTADMEVPPAFIGL